MSGAFNREAIIELDRARAFIEKNHQAGMATFHPDGSLQLTPVAVGLDANGHAINSTRETAYQTRNLRHDPRLSLSLFVDRVYGEWIQIDGTAEILALPETLEPLVDHYKRTWGKHEDWEEHRDAMEQEKRVLPRITLESPGPDRCG